MSVTAATAGGSQPPAELHPWQLSTAFTVAVSDKSLLSTLVSGAGHHLSRRAPEVIAGAIMAFLAAARIADIPITQPPVT